jgi:hypothetical protein
MFELGQWHVSGPVCVRSACRCVCSFSRSCSSVRFPTIVSSRNFQLTGSVVGGMRCMFFSRQGAADRHFGLPCLWSADEHVLSKQVNRLIYVHANADRQFQLRRAGVVGY